MSSPELALMLRRVGEGSYPQSAFVRNVEREHARMLEESVELARQIPSANLGPAGKVAFDDALMKSQIGLQAGDFIASLRHLRGATRAVARLRDCARVWEEYSGLKVRREQFVDSLRLTPLIALPCLRASQKLLEQALNALREGEPRQARAILGFCRSELDGLALIDPAGQAEVAGMLAGLDPRPVPLVMAVLDRVVGRGYLALARSLAADLQRLAPRGLRLAQPATVIRQLEALQRTADDAKKLVARLPAVAPPTTAP